MEADNGRKVNRICKICGEEKPIEKFGFNGRDRRWQCSACLYQRNKERSRDAKILKTYGLTRERFDQIVQEQGGVCAICHENRNYRGERLYVDHDHETGIVRGLLCSGCNVAIGYLRNNPFLAEAVAGYLCEHIELTQYPFPSERVSL